MSSLIVSFGKQSIEIFDWRFTRTRSTEKGWWEKEEKEKENETEMDTEVMSKAAIW